MSFDTTLSAATADGEFVTGTATDPAGNTSEFSGRVTAVANQAPTARAGGPYAVAEGGSVPLDATGSSDPNQSSGSLTYTWDLDGDGVFGETGAAASRGNETGAMPTFVPTGLDGPTSVTVTLRATDAGGLTGTATATISVSDAAPSAAVSGPTVGVPGHPLPFTLRADDPAAADDTAGFGFVVNWGDGSPLQSIPAISGNGAGVELTHAYTVVGATP